MDTRSFDVRQQASRSFTVTRSVVRSSSGIGAIIAQASPVSDVIFEDVTLSGFIDSPQNILCIKYTSDCEYLAAGFTDGITRVFKLSTQECVCELVDEDILEHRVPVTSIKHRPGTNSTPFTNNITCTYVNGYVKCWTYETGECLYSINEKRQTLGLAYHCRMAKFVTTGEDGVIYMYDEETKKQERKFRSSPTNDEMDGHMSRIFCANFHPLSPHEFISGGWDDTVMFWDIREPHSTRHLSGVHACGDCIDISQSGTEILTCAYQKKHPIQIWDYRSGRLMSTIEPDLHQSLLYCGKWLAKNNFVCGGTGSNIFRIVDKRLQTTLGCVRNIPAGVYSIDIAPLRKSRRMVIHKQGKENIQLPKMCFSAGRRIYEIECP